MNAIFQITPLPPPFHNVSGLDYVFSLVTTHDLIATICISYAKSLNEGWCFHISMQESWETVKL